MPLIVRWPGKVKAGLNATPVISTDFYPTLLSAAGIAAGKGVASDGEDLLPLLTAGKKLKRQAVFWHYPNFAFHRDNRLGSAIRAGDYKLLEFFDDQSVELYNLREDIGEKINLAGKEPELAMRLKAQLHAWRAETKAAMPKPR